MEIHLIAALTPQGVIGNNRGLPWHIKEDLQRFKKITTGETILMGKTTFATISKPLPNRNNIVLDKENEKIEGAYVCDSLEKALSLAGTITEELFVIGGASVYEQTLPMADTLNLSHLKENFPGNIYFPAYNQNEWQETGKEEYKEFTAVIYKRAKNHHHAGTN